jgi:hypothetical protein
MIAPMMARPAAIGMMVLARYVHRLSSTSAVAYWVPVL